MRHFVPSDVLNQLYHAFVSPHSSYALINWGNTTKWATTKLNISLKKAVRIMTFSGLKESLKPLFTKLGILNFENIFMYDISNKIHIWN